jgi:hypothetical protein
MLNERNLDMNATWMRFGMARVLGIGRGVPAAKRSFWAFRCDEG